jgi:uncharacterized protein YcgI (DUF1989 family)
VALLERHHLEPMTGMGLALSAGQLLRVIDPDGSQVADLVAFAASDRDEWLSSGRTIDDNGTIRLTTGHTLYSNRDNPMLAIVDDSVGRHDFLFAPCCVAMFARQYGVTGEHPNCLDNLSRALVGHGITPDRIPTPFNVFMNVDIDSETGATSVKAPLSRSGDFISLRADQDLVVAVSACSAGLCNGGTCGPIDVELHAAE